MQYISRCNKDLSPGIQNIFTITISDCITVEKFRFLVYYSLTLIVTLLPCNVLYSNKLNTFKLGKKENVFNFLKTFKLGAQFWVNYNNSSCYLLILSTNIWYSTSTVLLYNSISKQIKMNRKKPDRSQKGPLLCQSA